MKLQLQPSACAPVVLLVGQVPLILRLCPYHSGLCLFKPWTLCCMSSPLSLSLPSFLTLFTSPVKKQRQKPPPKKLCPLIIRCLPSTPSPLNISEATSVALSLSDVTGCYSATGPIWHQSCCSPPHTGIDCLFQLALFYIIDDARLYPAMAALQRNMSLIWYFKCTCHWVESLYSAIA